MKNYQKLAFLGAALAVSSVLNASSLTIQNINTGSTGAFGLFDEGGTRIDDALSSNIRVGYFTNQTAAENAWSAGDLGALDLVFEQYGADFGMFGGGFDGVFQGGPIDTDAQFSDKLITIWVNDASSSNSFTDADNEYLIYTFTTAAFPSDEVNGSATAILGEDAGSFLAGTAGDFGNYSFDYGLGGGALDGFNTVSVVPEPSTYAALSGLLALGYVMVRRRK